MGFADSFIRGYQAGHQIRMSKEEEQRKREQFEDEKQHRADELKRQQEQDKAESTVRQAGIKLKLLDLARETPAPKTGFDAAGFEVPEGQKGAMGQVPTNVPPVSIDLSGIGGGVHQVPVTFADKLTAQKLAEKKAELESAHEISTRPSALSPEAETALTGKHASGKKFSKADIEVLQEQAKLKSSERIANEKVNSDPLRALMAGMMGGGGTGGANAGGEGAGGATPKLPPVAAPYQEIGPHTGQPYIDSARLPHGKVGDAINLAAAKNGVPVLSKEDAQVVRNMHSVTSSLDEMLNQVQSKLPKDAEGRVVAAPLNKISKFLQTDEDLAAFNVWRDNAFQIVRALGGSSRMPVQEFQVAVNNIPTITDTLGTAQKKVQNLKTLLSNKEQSILGGQVKPKGKPKTYEEYLAAKGID